MIASKYVDRQRAEMKAMFDLAASNRDETALRASALVDRTVRCANYKVGDVVWIMDENHKKGVYPKLRPKWKRPFTVTKILNEVDAILKADGRSKKTIIRHFSKLKKCIGKPFVAPMNARDLNLDGTHMINEESINENSPAFPPNVMQVIVEDKIPFDHGSPSPMARDPLRWSQKDNSSNRNEEPEVGCSSKLWPSQAGRNSKQPVAPVKSVRRDEYSAAVDGRSSNSTVTSTFNAKQRPSELEPQAKPSQGNMKRSKRIKADLNKMISLRTNPMASTLEMTRIEEDLEEDQINDDRYINKCLHRLIPVQLHA